MTLEVICPKIMFHLHLKNKEKMVKSVLLGWDAL